MHYYRLPNFQSNTAERGASDCFGETWLFLESSYARLTNDSGGSSDPLGFEDALQHTRLGQHFELFIIEDE